MHATVVAAVTTAENDAATMAFAATTTARCGVAAKVDRMVPLRYSPVTVSADTTISSGTANTATPIAACCGRMPAAP